MKKIAFFVIGLSLFLLTQKAYALFWVYEGDYSGDVVTGLTVGDSNVNDPETGTSQPIQISGAGALLPSGYPGWSVNFHFNGSTWDSYNEWLDDEHTGYLDVFAAVLSEQGYYWNLADTEIHPLEDNPALILASNERSYWGGTSFDDGVREDEDEDVILDFNTDPTKQYYLTLFMQTRNDDQYPSWGTFTNSNASPVPEPTSLLLFGIGGLAMTLLKRKKKII